MNVHEFIENAVRRTFDGLILMKIHWYCTKMSTIPNTIPNNIPNTPANSNDHT